MSNSAISSMIGVVPGPSPVLPVARSTGVRPDYQPPSTPELAPAAGDAAEAASGSLEQAVSALNGYVTRTRTDLQFRVDDEAGQVVVSIVDSETGEVLRQMPSEDALRVARYLEGGARRLIDRQA